ncbi:MAG: UxaA family hydrolase, partial [Spirochaetales bacterium]|nr:UxaA family hydrolase [Spirochaetales bacterium]
MRVVKIADQDNVAVVVAPTSKGDAIDGTSLHVLCDIPQGHKVALVDLKKGDAVVRYGVILGYALEDIKAGGWVNEFNLALPSSPEVKDLVA